MLGIPHTVTTKEYSACAFTQKVLKFCEMMHSRGHTILHYGHERSQVQCTEHITVTNDEVFEKAYGNYNWRKNLFKHNITDQAHIHFNAKATEEVAKRKQRGDFLLLFWGLGHREVGIAHKDLLVVEPGIGCHNNLVAPFCVFESYAVMHHVYAKYNISPRFMDCVVPNYFDSNDFIRAEDKESEIAKVIADESKSETMKTILKLQPGYIVMIARLVSVKGFQVAIEACLVTGKKLVIAGQGSLQDVVMAGLKVTNSDPEDPKGVTHIGYIEPHERRILLANAKCLMAPTLYAEPFCGVNVEAQMAGLPVITTDWGVFNETVVHGITGWRCRTLDHFSWALRNLDRFDSERIRKYAIANYGYAKVASMYEEYFHMIATTLHKGYYQENPGRLGLTWLEKIPA